MGDTDESERPDEHSAATIRAGLERVLASDAFRAAPQLSAFLTFIVESAIGGRGGELKGYTIAVEALGRPHDFDPQSDPIVRVEAGRLRRALAQYYAGEGAGEPLRITMPVGAYIPVFAHVESGAMPPEGDEAAEPSQAPAEIVDSAAAVPPISASAKADRTISRRWPALAGVGLVMALLALAGWRLSLPGDNAPVPPLLQVALRKDLQSTAAMAAAPPRVTSLAIVTTPISDPGIAERSARFASLLVDALARFDDLLTVRSLAAGELAPPDVDYAFEMTIQATETTTEAFGRLRAVRDGRIVWTSSSTRALSLGADDPELAEMARRLATLLAEPFGLIQADSRLATIPPAMHCIFQAFDVRRTMKPEDHLAARNCIESVIERDETFHPAWSQLTFLILAEYRYGLNPQAGPPLDRAFTAALTALRLAPASARAQQAMMAALFARGATEEAIRMGRSATARNPYDPDIMADLGSRYVRLNRPAEGLPLLERAVGLSVGRPPWYDFFGFLAAHFLGAGRVADGYAAFLVADETPFSLLGRALQAARSGDNAALTSLMARLDEAAPLFRSDPRLYLAAKGFVAEAIDRILADLSPAAPAP